MQGKSRWELYKEKNGVTPLDLLNPKTTKSSDDIFNLRYSTCLSCEAFIKLTGQCKECGCFMQKKAKLESAKCPLNKWPNEKESIQDDLNLQYSDIIRIDSPKIIIIKNFISDEECKNILKVKDFPEELWNIDFQLNYPKQNEVPESLWHSMIQWEGMCINITKNDFYSRYSLDQEYYESLALKIKGVAEKYFNVNVAKEQYLINRWRKGREQKPHIDYFIDEDPGHDYDMLEKYNLPRSYLKTFQSKFQTKHFSSLLYLNDDFEGGEIYFPQYDNLSIKPEPGMLVCFAGNEKALHGVKEAIGGVRYTISLFLTDLARI